MSTKSRLDKLYATCPRIRLPENVKILFVADLHRGDGGAEDDFQKNSALFSSTIQEYMNQGYIIYGLGDLYDLWETDSPVDCPELANVNKIKGNHDNSLDYPEAVVLQIGDLEIFCAHGHQGDIFNDRLWWIGQNVVRYLWVPLQWIGLHNAQRAKQKRHETQEKRLCEWADDQKFVSVFGHTHLLANSGKFKDAGCWVNQDGEGIVYENGQFSGKQF